MVFDSLGVLSNPKLKCVKLYWRVNVLRLELTVDAVLGCGVMFVAVPHKS